MARKKKNETKEVVEELVVELEEKPKKKEFYNIVNANRLRLRLEKATLDGAGFDGVTIEAYDMRTIPLKGCVIKDSTFKGVNMQGCNMTEAAEIRGNTFIDCDLRWGGKPEGFEGNNTFINTRK